MTYEGDLHWSEDGGDQDVHDGDIGWRKRMQEAEAIRAENERNTIKERLDQQFDSIFNKEKGDG